MIKHVSDCSLEVYLLLNSCNLLFTQRGNTAVHHAAMQGHAEIIQMLADSGADLNAQDKVCHTATQTLNLHPTNQLMVPAEGQAYVS